MSGIPTANSPDNRNLADSTVVIETGIAEYSYFTNLSYGISFSPGVEYNFYAYHIKKDGDTFGGNHIDVDDSYGTLSSPGTRHTNVALRVDSDGDVEGYNVHDGSYGIILT